MSDLDLYSNIVGRDIVYGSTSGPQTWTEAETLRVSQLNMNYELLASSFPQLVDDPDALNELAANYDPITANQMGAQLFGMNQLRSVAKAWEGYDEANRRTLWSQMTDIQRGALIDYGVKPPSMDDDDPFLKDVFDVAAAGLGFVFSGIGKVAQAVPFGEEGLNLLAKIDDFPERAYRTIRQMDNTAQIAAALGGLAGGAAVIGGFAAAPFTGGTSIAAGLTLAGALAGASAGAAATNFNEFTDLWADSGNGEAVFLQSGKDRVRDLLRDSSLSALARDVAYNTSPYDLVVNIASNPEATSNIARTLDNVAMEYAEPGTPAYQQVRQGLDKLMQSKPFQQAVKTLHNSKISYGRDVARLVGLNPDQSIYHAVSGSIDGAMQIWLDPFLLASPALKAARFRNYNISDVRGTPFRFRGQRTNSRAVLDVVDNRIQLAYKNGRAGNRVRAMDEQIARAVDLNDPTLMPKDYRPLFTELVEFRKERARGVDNYTFKMKDFHDWMKEAENFGRLVTGIGTVKGIYGSIIIRPDADTFLVNRLKNKARVAINTLVDADNLPRVERQLKGLDSDDVLLPPTPENMPMHGEYVETELITEAGARNLPAELGKAVVWVPNRVGATFGRFLDQISNMAPRAPVVHLAGDRFIEDVTRTVNGLLSAVNMPSKYKQEWIRRIATESDVAGRAQLIFSLYDTIFTVTGLKETRRGRELFDEFIQKTKQSFGPGQLDQMAIAGMDTHVGRGVLAQHQSLAMAVPDMREMIKAVRYQKIYGDVLAGVGGDRFIDAAVNRFWKPSVILRLGFIPRAGGEEMLAQLMRGMDGQLGQEFAAKRVVARQRYEAMRQQIDDQLAAGMELTPAQQVAYDKRNSFLFRPLERLSSRLEFAADPINSFLDRYEGALRNLLDPALASQQAGRRNLAEMVNRQSDFVQALLTGKRGSWRRLGLEGVNADLLADARDFMRIHAATIMREVSAGSQSQIADIQREGQRILETQFFDGNQNLISRVDSRKRQEVGVDDPAYKHGLYERNVEIITDEFTGQAYSDAYITFKPDSILLDETQLSGIFNDFENLSYYQQELLMNLLIPRASRVDQFATRLTEDGFPEELVNALREHISPAGVDIQALRPAINQYLTTSINGQMLVDPSKIAVFNKIFDLLDALDPFASTGTSRWLHTQLTYLRRNPEQFKRLVGFDANNMPTYVRTKAEFDERFQANLLTALNDNAELADIMSRSNRVTQNKEGAPVVNRLSPNDTRFYSPDIDGFVNLDTAIMDLVQQNFTVDQIIETLADRYAQQISTVAPYNAYVNSLPLDTRKEALRLALRPILAEQLHVLQYAPLSAVGYADARIAQWVSETLSDTINADPFKQLHFYDAPRADVATDGASYMDATIVASGNLKAILHSDRTRYDLAPVRGKVQQADGTFGITQEEAFEELVQQANLYANYYTGERSGLVYEPLDGTEPLLVYRDGDFVPATQTRFGANDVVYDINRNRISIADSPDRFREVQVGGEDLNHRLVAPMISDRLDEAASKTDFKQVVSYRTLPNARQAYIDNMPLTWSGIEHIDMSVAPQSVVAKLERIDSYDMYDRIINYGFDRVITPALDAIARNPMAFHAFTSMRATSRTAMRGFLDPEAIDVVGGFVRTTDEAVSEIRRHTGRVFRDANGNPLPEGTAMGAYETIVDRSWNNAAASQKTVIGYLRDEVDLPTFQAAFGDIITVRSLKEYNEFLDGLQRIDNWSYSVDEIASRAAINSLEPFLDTSDARSMFSLYYKNILPFWYAEENFIKRWLRGAMTSGTFGLDQLRKFQLGYAGLRTAGIIHTDENGTDWVVYPGSGLLPNILGAITPYSTENVGTMFASTTTSLLPGFNEEAGRPGVGPVAQLPLRFGSILFPEYFRETERAIVGDIGASQSIRNLVLPASVRRLFDAVTSNENNAKFVAAMDAAMIMLQAEDKTRLPNNATPEQQEEFLQRAKDHARIIMLSGALTGFITMGAPVAITSGTEFKDNPFAWLTGIGIEDPAKVVNATYRSYLQAYGYEEGIDRFLADYPDATVDDIVNPLAFTVSRTETVGGRGIPATESGLQWAQENRDFIGQYTYASGWFAPVPESVEDFDRYAYQESFNLGVRKTRPPREVMISLIFQRSSQEYFRQMEIFDAQIRNAPDAKKAEIRADMELFKSQFYAANPIFAHQLSSTENANRRQETISQMRQALRDPFVPKGEAAEAYTVLIDALDEYQSKIAALGPGQRAVDRRYRDNLKAQFVGFGDVWADAYPQYASFWSTVVKLTVE
jgi:hypothetical protein